MKKLKTKQQLEDALDHIKRLGTGERVSVYDGIFASLDSCTTFDNATAEYVRKRIKLYLDSWVVPKIEAAIKELSK